MEMSKEQHDILAKVYNRLREVSKFNEIIEISRFICYMNISREEMDQGTRQMIINILQILQKHFGSTRIISNHKVIIKTIVKLAILCDVNAFEDNDKYAVDHGIIGANCISAYGRLQNYKLFDNYVYNEEVLYDTLVQCSLKYSKNTKFFALAIENYIQACDIKIVKKYDSFLITVICTNLENSHNFVHKLLLDLFQRILVINNDNDKEIVEIVMNKMSWYNRNKHYLLCQIIMCKPDILLNYKEFDLTRFMNGLRIGLSQYHLYSSSTSFIKVIHERDPFWQALKILSADIILNGSEYEMRNFFRFWFSSLNDKLQNEIFATVTKAFDFTKVSSTSTFFHRSLVIRNSFNRPLSFQMENSIKTFCYSINDVGQKLEIFNVLLNNIYDSKVFIETLEHILRFLKFLHFNMCVEDSLFIDNVIKKLPNFFNFLATSRFRSIEVCKEIFTIIRDDIYLHGITFGTYETKVFSVKILQIMLKQYCGNTKGRRLSKKTDSKNNKEFKIFLKDNGIWDITSIGTFEHLVEMSQDTENSDISGIANEIIIEYFIKTMVLEEDTIVNGVRFREWLNNRMSENLKVMDIESYHENISYCKMKIEHLISKNYSETIPEIVELINELENNKLEEIKDPVNAMQSGNSIFAFIDTINYAVSRIDTKSLSNKLILRIVVLTEKITLTFLDFVNDGKTAPSFDSLDKNLSELVNTSIWRSNDSSDTKQKLLLSFFFTIRALSELTVALAKIINNNFQPHENDYFTGLSTCININIQILTRFCHKGVIEASSQSLGCITKIISSEFLQQCDRSTIGAKNLQKLLIMLKHEIDCGKRHTSKTGEIRGSRGLVLMSHLIIKNHPPFIKFVMEQLLDLIEIKSFYDTQKIKFMHNIQPIHLHLLAVIVKDSELVEDMLPYYDYILLATFRSYKESKDFVMQNALLQIIGNITPKISNFKRHFIDESDKPMYESKSISVYEHYVKFTYSYRIALFDLENNLDNLSQTYIIILLEILSNFEHREPYDYWSEMDRIVDIYKRLINHSCEKIRILAAKCFSQWQRPDKMLKVIKDKIRYIFREDPNLAHGSLVAVKYMIQRYEASIKFVHDFDKEHFLMEMREKVLESLKQSYSIIPKNFYLRYHLFDFLLFLGFNLNDSLIQELMNEESVKSTVGYQLWHKKIRECRNQAF